MEENHFALLRLLGEKHKLPPFDVNIGMVTYEISDGENCLTVQKSDFENFKLIDQKISVFAELRNEKI